MICLEQLSTVSKSPRFNVSFLKAGRIMKDSDINTVPITATNGTEMVDVNNPATVNRPKSEKYIQDDFIFVFYL